jgi:hypothetical protein
MKKILLLILFAGIIVAVYYFISFREENESRNIMPTVVPPDVAREQDYLNSLTDKEIQEEVFFTLSQYVIKPEFGGKVFCADSIFGYDKTVSEKSISVYVWAYCEEYYLKGSTVRLGAAVSKPVKVKYISVNQKLNYDSIIVPNEGSGYKESITEMFPKEFQDQAVAGIDNTTLIPSPKVQADNYYKGRLEVYF